LAFLQSHLSRLTGNGQPDVGMSHFVDQLGEQRLIQRVAETQMKLPSLAGLDAAPEFPLGSNDKVLVERIGMDLDLHLLAAPGDYGEHRRPRTRRPTCYAAAGPYTFAASSENDHGSRNFDSNTAPLPRDGRRGSRPSTGLWDGALAAGYP
jgi:hypothetical protein